MFTLPPTPEHYLEIDFGEEFRNTCESYNSLIRAEPTAEISPLTDGTLHIFQAAEMQLQQAWDEYTSARQVTSEWCGIVFSADEIVLQFNRWNQQTRLNPYKKLSAALVGFAHGDKFRGSENMKHSILNQMYLGVQLTAQTLAFLPLTTTRFYAIVEP